jgi:predicted metal-binding membrane protein
MAALFALGVMSIAWMLLIAALIAIEKLLPWRLLATGATVALLAVLGVAIVVAPAHVPWLTVPMSM